MTYTLDLESLKAEVAEFAAKERAAPCGPYRYSEEQLEKLRSMLPPEDRASLQMDAEHDRFVCACRPSDDPVYWSGRMLALIAEVERLRERCNEATAIPCAECDEEFMPAGLVGCDECGLLYCVKCLGEHECEGE